MSSLSHYRIKLMAIPASNGSVAQLTQVVEAERQHPHAVDAIPAEGREASIPNAGVWTSQAPKQTLKPSPATWQCMLMLGDTLLLLALAGLSWQLANMFHLVLQASDYGIAAKNSLFIWMCLIVVSWAFAISIMRPQESSKASSRFSSPLSAILTMLLMLICCNVLAYLFDTDKFFSYAKILLLFFLLAVPAFSVWRVLLAAAMNAARFRPGAVIIGTGKAGEALGREFREVKRPVANVLGYISESSNNNRQIEGLHVLGGKSALRQLIRAGTLDMIIMALDYKTSPQLFQQAIEAAHAGIAVVPMPMIYERMSGKIPVEHIGDQWYVPLPPEPLNLPLYIGWRKAIDLLFGLLGLPVLLLLLLFIAPLIYLDSPGPIFYSQERVGYRGRTFRILKFRSMRTDAEMDGNAVWATTGDTRVTRLGKLLRATHLDELPQVLNILRGDMSLIGPRPERQEFVLQLEKQIPLYRCRLRVKPGLTGWAQVKYSYTSTSQDALVKLQYDLYYIKHQSCVLDIFILLKTIVEMLLCRGR